MNERKYNVEIEGLMVEITYEYEEGCKGDRDTPPTGDRVTILSWKLLEDSDKIMGEYSNYSDDEWKEWMSDIDHYVHHHAEYDIIEFEHDLEF